MRYLYIIGNGFDIAHGINSRYSDYRNWLKEHKPELFHKLVSVYGDEETFWRDFETNLSAVDIDNYKTNNFINYKGVTESELLGTMESIRWCPAASQIKDLFTEMLDSFDYWVLSLQVGKQKKKFKIRKRNAFFVTFNYTNTLEVVYKVPERKAFHIHGQANNNEKLEFGHGMDKETLSDLYKKKHGISEDYVFDEDTENMIDQVARLHKPVRYILRKKQKKFEALINVKRIKVIGFSFSEIDMDYLNWIVEHHKQINAVKWKVTWHSKEDEDRILSFLKKIIFFLKITN